MKSSIRALSWTLGAYLLVFVLAMPAHARISIEGLGGDIEIEGFISSEARARVGSGDTYLTQWLQRLQIEATLQYTDVGIFDELSFTTVVRPEFDVGYYENLGGRGVDSDKPSYLGRNYTYDSDPVGHGGFDFFFAGFGVGLPGGSGQNALSTGGIGKIVTHGQKNQQWLTDNFETILGRNPDGSLFSWRSAQNGGQAGFPVLAATNQMELRCSQCLNLDNDPLDVAMNNVDNESIYPFRELYMDGIIGDWWIRLGKQQIVWGKTDFFRLQDVLNPVDFGQHFFFDSFEDIRIPQWMLSVQYKAGALGPLTDNAFQFVWNFDEFRPVGLGNPSHPWAHPFSKEKTTFAGFNHFFSVEPCIGAGFTPQAYQYAPAFFGGTAAVQAAIDANPTSRCGALGPNDHRLPSGFGQPVGLNYEDRPDWDISHTEPAVRWEFRFKAVRMAFTHTYGYQDIPVFRFHSVNVGSNVLSAGNLGCDDRLVFDLAADLVTGAGPCTASGFYAGRPGETNVAATVFTGGIPVNVMDPQAALYAIADPTNANSAVAVGSGDLDATGAPLTYQAAAQAALATGNAEVFWRQAGGGAIFGGQTDIQYKQSHTTGMAIDYFEPWSGVVFRIESSITMDELVNNTRKANWVDHSDVMRWSIGLDRPTFIPWLNKDRTFFLSMQIFDTWFLNHEGDKDTGYFVDEHNFITTFFFIGNYMRDTLKPIGFLVWEEAASSWTAGLNVEWLMDNHWSIKGGMHTIWAGDNNFTHDSGPFTSFIVPGTGMPTGGGVPERGYHHSVFGVAREGIGALRDNDEVFLQLKYQF